jgi:hypothetical protein
MLRVALKLQSTSAAAAAAAAVCSQVHGAELVQTDLLASLLPRLAGAVDLLVGFRVLWVSQLFGAFCTLQVVLYKTRWTCDPAWGQ